MMPKYVKLILACAICLGVALVVIWVVERLGL